MKVECDVSAFPVWGLFFFFFLANKLYFSESDACLATYSSPLSVSFVSTNKDCSVKTRKNISSIYHTSSKEFFLHYKLFFWPCLVNGSCIKTFSVLIILCSHVAYYYIHKYFHKLDSIELPQIKYYATMGTVVALNLMEILKLQCSRTLHTPISSYTYKLFPPLEKLPKTYNKDTSLSQMIKTCC